MAKQPDSNYILSIRGLPDFRFRGNPESIKWGYRMAVQSHDTRGGAVKYPTNIAIDDMVLTGRVGVGGVDELIRVARWVWRSMHEARDNGTYARLRCFLPTRVLAEQDSSNFYKPSRWPDWIPGTRTNGFDWNIYIQSMSNIGQDNKALLNQEFSLSFAIITNQDVITKSRLSLGTGTDFILSRQGASYHKVSSGDTLRGLANKYYPSNVSHGMLLIKGANQGVVRSNGALVVGTQVLIPRVADTPELPTVAEYLKETENATVAATVTVTNVAKKIANINL